MSLGNMPSKFLKLPHTLHQEELLHSLYKICPLNPLLLDTQSPHNMVAALYLPDQDLSCSTKTLTSDSLVIKFYDKLCSSLTFY